MPEHGLPSLTALRLSGASVLLGNAALIGGIVVSTVFGLGSEALPLTSAEGLQKLGAAATAFRMREIFWLLYPVLLVPEMIALYMLLRHRSPALVWPLIFWCMGLTLGIGVDAVTATIAPNLGLAYNAATPTTRPAIEAFAGSLASGVLATQLLCDTLSGTFVYPFVAVAAYRAGFVSRTLALIGGISAILVCAVYRGLNLFFPDATALITLFGFGFYGLIWWDVSIGLKLLRLGEADRARLALS